MTPFILLPEGRPPKRPPILDDEMRISVRPVYVRAHSRPPDRQVFVYFIRIENVGRRAAQLFWRHWNIHDAVAGDQEVEGEGVVGRTPVLAPGDVHEYSSFCVLQGRSGHMEGWFHFRREDGVVFRAPIPRFELRVPREGPPGPGREIMA